MKKLLFCIFIHSYILATPPDFTALGIDQIQKEQIQDKYHESLLSKQWQGSPCSIEFDKEEYEIDFYTNALQNHNSTTEGILTSLDYAYKEYEKLLDKYYAIAQNHFATKELKDALNNDQTAWLNFQTAQEAYLDQHYNFLSLNEGGVQLRIDRKRASLLFLKKRVVELFESYYCQP